MQYSQEVIDRYFALNPDMQKSLRIVIAKKDHIRHLAIQEKRKLSYITTKLASLGLGNASFKSITALCYKLHVVNSSLDRAISRYNAISPFYKRVPRTLHAKLQQLLLDRHAEKNAIYTYDLHLLYGKEPIDIERAASHGATRLLREVIPQSKSEDIQKALELACIHGKFEAASELLNHCPISSGDWRLFFVASTNGHFDVAYKLLEKAGGVEWKNEKGETALHLAAIAGNLFAIKLLITNGAKVCQQDLYGLTALDSAVSGGLKDAVSLLIENGAKITSQTVALAKNPIVKELLEIEQLDEASMNKLMHASKVANLQLMKKLIAKHALVNAKGQHGKTALFFAVESGTHFPLELLVTHGANIHARDDDGKTALSYATALGHLESVKYLLQQGATSELEALSLVRTQDPAIALLLVKKIADRNKKPFHDVLKQTVPNREFAQLILQCYEQELFHGRLFKECGICQGLIHHHPHEFQIRAALDKILIGKESPDAFEGLNFLLFMAIKNNLPHIVRHVLNSRANRYAEVDGETALILACRLGHATIVDILLEDDPITQIKMRDEYERSPFEVAVANSHFNIASTLLKIAPDLVHENKNRQGQRPLHLACIQGNLQLVELLLQHKASLAESDNAGRTALALAASYGHIQVVKKLLEKQPKEAILQRDSFGVSPLERALFGGHFETAKLLIEAGAMVSIAELKRQIATIDSLLQGRTGVKIQINQRERIFKTLALVISRLTKTKKEAESLCCDELKLNAPFQKEILKNFS